MNSIPCEQLESQLKALKKDHAALDVLLQRLCSDPLANQIRVQRLKKRKLALKDEIARLENLLLPDIIA